VFRLAVKQVRHNPKRLILTAVAVALGVSLVTTTFTFTHSLSSGFSSLFSEIYAGNDVLVEPDPAAEDTSPADDPFAPPAPMFSDADVAAVQAVKGVEFAAGGYQVAGVQVLPPASDQPDAEVAPGIPAGVGGPPTQMFGWTGNARIDATTVVEGRGPQADGEIVLDLDSAASLGYAVGDAVRVQTDSGITELTLVGTVRFGEDNNLQGATLAQVAMSQAHLLGGEEGYHQIAVIATQGQDVDALAGAVATVIPDGARAITGEKKAAEQIESLDQLLTYINIFAIVFALIALFVGGYIIVNTFRIIVTQRTRELGLLRAIGATGTQVRNMILLEALVVSIIASTVGIVLGYLLALAIGGIVTLIAGDILGALVVPWEAVALSYGLGALVTLVAALMPALHAARISPMEALRESATAGRKPLTLRNIVGSTLALLGVVAVALGLFASVTNPAIYVGVGAVLLVLGVTLLAAQVLVPMAYGLRGLLTSRFGVDGKLAANNIRREPRRSANTAAALMIGVMLLALIATFTESLKAVVTAQFQQTEADFFVMSATGDIPAGAMDVIASVDGVDFVTALSIADLSVNGEDQLGMVVDPEFIDRAFALDTDRPLTQLDGGVFVGPDLHDQGVNVGDTITVKGREGSAEATVTGLYAMEGDADVIMDFDLAGQVSGDVPLLQGFAGLSEGADADAMQTTIMEALSADYPMVLLQQPGQLEQLARSLVDMILAIISSLLASALVIAILGVANTLLLSVTERTREIGLLRAVGLKRGSIWRMITVESLVMAIFGTILGMILGVGLGAALVTSLADFGFQGVAIPWAWMAVYTVASAIAGVLAAIWPAWRASRMDILQAIAADG